MLLVYGHKVPDYLPLAGDIQKVRTVEPGLRSVVYGEKSAGGNYDTDWFGQNWIYEPTIKAYNPDAGNYIVKDITKWRDYVTFPDLDAIDWEAKFKADAVKWDPDKLWLVVDGYGLWERAFSMVPIADLLCALIEEPEACEDFFSAIADHKIKLHNYYLDYYKPDVLCMHDDYGSGQGLFMSPGTWRRLIKPSLQRVIDNAVTRGIMYEHHCCGYLAPLAEEIAEMGASSWNLIHVCNDPPACKQKFGDKLAFIEGICDGQYLDTDSTTGEQVREHVRATAEKNLPGLGVVIGVKLHNHPERLAIFNEELLRCGQLFYRENRPE